MERFKFWLNENVCATRRTHADCIDLHCPVNRAMILVKRKSFYVQIALGWPAFYRGRKDQVHGIVHIVIHIVNNAMHGSARAAFKKRARKKVRKELELRCKFARQMETES